MDVIFESGVVWFDGDLFEARHLHAIQLLRTPAERESLIDSARVS